LRQNTGTDKGKASPCRLGAKPLSSKAGRLACHVFCCLHTRTFGARSSGRALPFLEGAAFDLLCRPRLPALRAAFRALPATSLHDTLKSRSQSDSRSALKHCCAAFREPRHFDPRARLAGRSWRLLAKRVAVARFAIWPRRHGLRPRSHPRTLGRPQGSARSLQKPPLALFSFSRSPLECGGSPALRQNRYGDL
jgi:hypothetical protein